MSEQETIKKAADCLWQTAIDNCEHTHLLPGDIKENIEKAVKQAFVCGWDCAKIFHQIKK